MEVPNVLAERLHVLMNNVWGDTANLHETIVLDKYRVASKIPMYDRRIARVVQIAEATKQKTGV